MDQIEIPFSLRCPNHRVQTIGLLNTSPNAEKIGYCYECIARNDGDGPLSQTLKSVSVYLEDTSNFYEECRQRRVQRASEPPAEYFEELSKKRERLEKFRQHIDKEKEKVQRGFEEIRRAVEKIVDDKEKECLDLLDKEILDLSEAYRSYEKLLMTGWPKQPDIQNIYPQTDILVQRLSQVGSMDELRAFMIGIQEDVKLYDLYFKEDDGVSKLRKKMDDLIRSFSIPEGSFPKIQSRVLNLGDLESSMKDFMKRFIQLEDQVENSFESRMKASAYESKIINDVQFITLKDWLPEGYNFDLKLLFRSSEDGDKFHEKCDGKGATITLIKCLFNRAVSSSIIGGFLDQSWHSKGSWSGSKKAFLFSLRDLSCNSVKCPIKESEVEDAFFGGIPYGPLFGTGYDLHINMDLKSGGVNAKSYLNAIALHHEYAKSFKVEEVEVYQVF